MADSLFASHDPQAFFNSGYKTTIIECGHGARVANSFLCEPGASAFVLESKQPYSKAVQEKLYGSDHKRSVSKEFIYSIFRREIREIPVPFSKHMIVASSFQLGDDKSMTHGYVGIAETTGLTLKTTVYHLSFYRKFITLSKANQIAQIGMQIINIMAHHMLRTELKSYAIDAVWDNSGHLVVGRTIEIAASENFENFVCFKRVGQELTHLRFEDIVRENRNPDDRGIVFQKGSFNPLHRMHEKIAANSRELYPNYPHVMVISGNTCDKGTNSHHVLEKRVRSLTHDGYTVIITNSGRFIDNLQHITNHYGKEFTVVFPGGEDTIERFFRDWESELGKNGYSLPPSDSIPSMQEIRINYYAEQFANAKWLISKRDSATKEYGPIVDMYRNKFDNIVESNLKMDDISSTKIRNGEYENTL